MLGYLFFFAFVFIFVYFGRKKALERKINPSLPPMEDRQTDPTNTSDLWVRKNILHIED